MEAVVIAATAVIGIVSLAKAMCKLTDKDKAQIEDILCKE